MKTGRYLRWHLWLVLGLLIVTALACTLPWPRRGAGPSVAIDSPPSGTTVEVGQEVTIQSTSTDAQGITKVELWVDEALVHTDSSPVAKGQTPFSVLQSWTPLSPGEYTIVVKAYNAAGQVGESEAITLSAVEVIAEASPTPSLEATETPTPVVASPTPTSIPTSAPTSTSTPTGATPTPTNTATPTSTPTPTQVPGACPLRRLATIGVGVHPKGVAVDATQAYVGLHDSPEVAVTDRATNLFKAKWGSGAPAGQVRYANGLAIAKGRLYVANRNGNSVSAILISNPADVKPITVGSLPFGVAATTDYVFVANFGANSVSIINANNFTVNTVSVSGNPTMVATLGNSAYVATWQEGVYKVGSDGSVTQVLPPRTSYFGVAANPTNNRVYVANQNGKDITVLNAADNTVVATISLGFMPHAIAANPQNNRIYVVAAGENKLYVIDGNTNKVLGSVAVNQNSDTTEGGQGITVYENRIYVSEWVGNLAVFDDWPCP